ncbi:transcription factor bHLH51 [Eucalyptus grandis]|uniref:BHLH domain-containing protein n=2 Tax=Eucalyptus grandis TaxID=71139 RepID=A0A059AAS9_EUCGR|nr:transcription factor bHLH51 [Eucalyptus grandis]KAK3407834.1 hypothetical protein EUGRSUZ_J00190 [Eucalyptus grandis]
MENLNWLSEWSGEADWVHSDEQLNRGSYPIPSQAAMFNPIQVCDENFPWLIPIGGVMADDRATSASASASASASVSKSHSQAEKRRRDRINAQLATLRKLIPKSEKMDKAALLASVIDHVKDLKRKASEISKSITILPSEVDEVIIDCEDPELNKGGNDSGAVLIRVSICCDDRPELLSELTRVIKGLKLTTVKADVASVGGRIKSVLILCGDTADGGGGGDRGACLSSLKQSLKVVVSRIACSSMAASNCRIRSKRQRFFLPCQSPLP